MGDRDACHADVGVTVEAATSAAFALHVARRLVDRMPELRLTRKQAIWDLYHESGLNHLEVETLLTDGLKARGLTGEEIWGLGVSHDSILRITGTRRRPKPRPT